METLKYTVIKNEEQYKGYCNELREIVIQNSKENNPIIEDQIDLLTLLIETWDEQHNTLGDLDPIQLLKSLMKDHKMKSNDLAKILGTSKSLISSMLNYRRGLSKEIIRKLSAHFKLSQEAFNRSYKLISPVNKQFKYASVMNSKKDLETV
jgi:HTH-type transcriptional regulator/antitoxin HigA